MRIDHIALGGCLRAPPVSYGATADTGGHIAYVLAAAAVQAAQAPFTHISLITRRFEDARLGAAHRFASEPVSARVGIERIATGDCRYLEKEALAAELPSFIERYCTRLDAAPRPQLIHAHFADAAAVALAARERFGIPFVYTPHALGLDKVAHCSGDAMTSRLAAERRAIETADAIVVSSRDEAHRQIEAYGVTDARRRVHVIAPGAPALGGGARVVPPFAFAEPHRPLMLAVARPTHKKNLIAVIEAFAHSRLRDVVNLAILAGQHDAGLRDVEGCEVLTALREISASPALAGCIALPPKHTSADVHALYRIAARSGGVFVSPALHEPFGLTLLEAAAAGLPVVATAHGGAADIVGRVGHGLLVDPRDRTAIAAACLRVIEEPRLRRRLVEASRGFGDDYSWDRYGRQTLSLYARLAAAPAQSACAAA